jgi:hypothetical protein
MPKTNDNAKAAKAKKQKIILIGGAVLLAAVAAFQVPKLMKGGSTSTPPAAAATGSDSSAVSAGSTSTASTPAAAAPTSTGKTVAVVAGVPLKAGPSVHLATNQLVSFTLFDVKDPFVQQADDTTATPDAVAPAATPTTDATGDGAAVAPPITSASQGTPPATEKPAPLVYATIDFDGKPQQLQVKAEFPTDEPLFVLRSLKKKRAKIGVAGGAFDDGSTITLKLNKKVTLVNTATGVRYELKLVYTGTTPEVIEGFTTTNGSSDATASPATTTPTTTTSTDGATTATAG